VIPDEFGTSVEIFSRVLRYYHVPTEEIHTFVAGIRADGYEMLRDQLPAVARLSEMKLNLSHMEIASFRLHPYSSLVGKSLAESELRSRYGVTVLLIRRENNVLSNPLATTQLEENDIVVVVGEKVALKETQEIFGSIEQEMAVT
jgi:CPA2 family monovalent cation:H+ antiporter-2